MTLEELRKGNYIQEDDGFIWKVAGVGQETISVTPPNSKLVCTAIFENFLPIPLTEDIIKKCGFIQESAGGLRFDEYKIGNISVAYIPGGTESYQLIYHRQCFPVFIKYLHDLQNIYYVLSNKTELEVRL